ncbi:MAG: TRAP transporter large permease [Alphaproteobacteria bacterium]
MAVLPIALLILGFPIFTILLVSSIVAMATVIDMPVALLHTKMFDSVDSLALISVPFFIFAGGIMAQGGISQRIVDWVLSIMGGVRGSLALTTVGTSTVFGAISGSSPATVAAVGGMLYTPLREKGYEQSYAAGLIASSGAIASIIPPSIVMILYGASAEQSVSDLFIAGILPGLLIALLMALYITLYVRRRGIRESGSFELRRFGRATWRGALALGTPVIVLGGIYLGAFSPTEAAGLACLYGIIVACVIYRALTWKGLWGVAVESVRLTAQVLIIVAAAGVFSHLLTVEGVPQSIAATIQGLQAPDWAVLLVINLFLLLIGCVLDPASAILVLTPILVPIVRALGIDLIHFGIIMTVNLSIGMFTPPFGLNIFVTQAMFKVPLSKLYPGLLPFILVNLVALLIVTYVPELSLLLLRFMG